MSPLLNTIGAGSNKGFGNKVDLEDLSPLADYFSTIAYTGTNTVSMSASDFQNATLEADKTATQFDSDVYWKRIKINIDASGAGSTQRLYLKNTLIGAAIGASAEDDRRFNFYNGDIQICAFIHITGSTVTSNYFTENATHSFQGPSTFTSGSSSSQPTSWTDANGTTTLLVVVGG